MRQFMRLGIVVMALVVSGCGGSAQPPTDAPPKVSSVQGANGRTDGDPHTTRKHEIVVGTRNDGDEPETPASESEPPLDPPATEPATAAPSGEKHFLLDPDRSPDSSAAGTSSKEPTGSGAPLEPPAPSTDRPPLPSVIRINPLRPKTSSRATGEPLIIETQRGPTLRGGSAASRAPQAMRSLAPSLTFGDAPQLPGADRPATDIPDDGASSAVPRAPESTPVPSASTADFGAADPPILPAAVVPAPQDRLVKVFFGTDRRATGDPQEYFEWSVGWAPGLVAGFLAIIAAIGAYLLPGRRMLLTTGAGLAATLAGVLILRGPLASEPPVPQPSEIGVEFTSERGRMSVGWCEVSIPPDHDPGEVESPSLLRLEFRPDPDRHVVLQRVVRDEREPFFEAVRERVRQSSRRDLFVFVHGYNVSFEDAARRTAQISYDLHFEGAALFFSWPSQGEIIKYTVDETNVAWSATHLKEFLLDLVRRTDAKSVNLIAHSMGNRALGAAIRELETELRQENALFDEVVLAAPDIDAGIFKRDIAPVLRRAARHATLYASTHDQALLVSKVVHGYPRAGDSGAGLVVVDGIDTIDVSRIDLSLLGHSYYGSSEPILEDLSELISESRPPSQRRWLRPAERDGLTYWMFRDDLRNRRPRLSMRPTSPK